MTPFELAHIVRRQGRQFRQRHTPTERTQRMTTTDTTTRTTITAMADGCEAAISDQGATMPDWEEIAKWHLEGIREQAEAMEASIELQDIALHAAAAYIAFLEKGKGPSHPHYLPLRDCYRNALDDLQGDGSDAP